MNDKSVPTAARSGRRGPDADGPEPSVRRKTVLQALTGAVHRPFLAASLLLALLIQGATAVAVSAADSRPLITEAGWITGFTNTSIPEGHYEALLLIAHLGTEINRFIPALKRHRGTLSVFLEPQVNPVFKPSSSEFGLGIGLQYTYPLNGSVSPYFLLVTGPQYLRLETETQANGLNFSNAAGIGVYIALNKGVALNIGYRYRHVSNADLRQPNGGINSHVALVGLSLFF